MKKTFLLTVLILSIVLGATAYAATETQKTEITPDLFWNGGEDIDYTYQGNRFTFAEGTLPTQDTGSYMSTWRTLAQTVGRTRFLCFGTGYVDGVDDVITASAAPESDGSSNIVFKLTGDQRTILADVVYQAGELADTRRHSIKFKLSENIPSNGTVGLFVLSGDADNAGTVQSDGTGVYISNGGAYILDRLNGGQKVWFIEENTLTADTWYTAETLVEILADGYIVQNATIKDETGAVVGKSDCYKVSSLEKSACGGNYDLLQLYTENLGSGTVMLDDWKTYAVTGTPAKGTITFVQDSDKAIRKTYKFETGIVLDSARINNDLVTVTCVSDPTMNLTGKYTVTCDNTAIVVTMDESLPMATKFKMEIDADKMLSMTDGYVAFDYSSTDVTDSMTQEFTTPSISEIFVTSFSESTPTPTSTITLSNGDVVEHEYMIVASLVRAGKYLETAATHGTLAARDAITSAPTVAPALPIPAFTTPTASGDKIMIMVWDNWQDMNSYTDTIPKEISVP